MIYPSFPNWLHVHKVNGISRSMPSLQETVVIVSAEVEFLALSFPHSNALRHMLQAIEESAPVTFLCTGHVRYFNRTENDEEFFTAPKL